MTQSAISRIEPVPSQIASLTHYNLAILTGLAASISRRIFALLPSSEREFHPRAAAGSELAIPRRSAIVDGEAFGRILRHLCEREVRRGPFGFAQGRLFDSAETSLREVPAPLKMTTGKGWLKIDGSKGPALPDG